MQKSFLDVSHWSVSLATTSMIDRKLPEHAPQTAVGRVTAVCNLTIHDRRQSHAIAALPTNDSVRSNVDEDEVESGSSSRTEQRSSAVSRLSSRKTCRSTGA